MAAEWRGILGRSWNCERPLVFTHVVRTKKLGVCRPQETRAWIIWRMDLWERGLHAGLVGNVKAEGTAQEGKAAFGGEEEDKAMARIYHDTVLSGKLRHSVRRATNSEEGGCVLLDDQCMKTGRLVSEVLRGKHPDVENPT